MQLTPQGFDLRKQRRTLLGNFLITLFFHLDRLLIL